MEFQTSVEPYPGLRSFYSHEADIFFGRDEHISDQLEKLSAHGFLCITGPSGSGKSSIARTGLINAIQGGFMPNSGSDWIIVDLHPGSHALESLVEAVSTTLLDQDNDQLKREEIHQLVNNQINSPAANIREIFNLVTHTAKRPVLIYIDQFEELFRIEQSHQHENEKFINLLLEAASPDNNTYVLITSRTEQLENCSIYPGLTEAINKSQFLTPILDRFQIQEVIDGPIGVFGGSIEPELKNWLLDSTDHASDKLPLLQHALKQTYTYKRKLLDDQEKQHDPVEMTMDDFLSAHGLQNVPRQRDHKYLERSLSNRLDEIYHDLPSDLKQAASRVFCELTDIKMRGRDIRRPRSIQQLSYATGLSADGIVALIEPFMTADQSYLRIHENDDNAEHRQVDVVHECILRLWSVLKNEWLPTEQSNAQKINFLAGHAQYFSKERTKSPILSALMGRGYLGPSIYDSNKKWFEAQKPNVHWARRYLSEFVQRREKTNEGKADFLGERSVNNETSTIEKLYSKIEDLMTASYLRRQMMRLATGAVVASFVLGAAYLVTTEFLGQQKELNDLNAQIGKLFGDEIETRDEFGKTLYLTTGDNDGTCATNKGFCDQIRQHNSILSSFDKFKDQYNKPICQNLDNFDSITLIGGAIPSMCSRYPKPHREPQNAPPKYEKLSGESRAYFSFGQSILKNSKTREKNVARAIFFKAASLSLNNESLFQELAEAYRKDTAILPGRRFSEQNSCAKRMLEITCLSDGNDVSAKPLYVRVDHYIKNNLGNLILDERKNGLSLVKDYVGIQLMLANQFLDEKTLKIDLSSKPNREVLSRLWRGFDAASDAARGILKNYQCKDVFNKDEPSCVIALDLYTRASKALELIIKAGSFTSDKSTSIEDKGLAEETAFGIGLASLHWAQDKNFRSVAKDVSGDLLAELLREAREAVVIRQGKPRYPSAVAILLCFNKEYSEAVQMSETILSDRDEEREKYENIIKKVASCQSSKDLGDHFEEDEPSE